MKQPIAGSVPGVALTLSSPLLLSAVEPYWAIGPSRLSSTCLIFNGLGGVYSLVSDKPCRGDGVFLVRDSTSAGVNLDGAAGKVRGNAEDGLFSEPGADGSYTAVTGAQQGYEW